jgi:hypothetical protein
VEPEERRAVLSKAKRLRLLIGAFLLALSMTLTGVACQGGEQQKKDEKKEEKKDEEKNKDEEKKDGEQKKDEEKK